MPLYTDQTGRTIDITENPSRIISLVPSLTELLSDLGLASEVVGITKFCIHPPEWYQNKKRVGGTKKLNLELINRLRPDLIIANKEENEKEQVEELAEQFPVWISNISRIHDALDMIRDVGTITSRIEKAGEIIAGVRNSWVDFRPPGEKINIVYLIWNEPYITIGGDTFINDMLRHAGFNNVFADRSRYPAVTPREISDSGADILMLSSEPYPFSDKQASVLQDLLPSLKILFVDGEIFSWYGSRMLLAPAYFRSLWQNIHQLN